MNNDKINWSDLSEKEKEQVAKSLAKAYEKAIREIALETAYELATPKWMKKINQLLCFHDWKVLDVSHSDSHHKCSKCKKQRIVSHF